MFKKLPGINLSYSKQGYVYFTCQTYSSQPKVVREKIDRLLRESAGEYEDALRKLMCTQQSVEKISREHFVSYRTLYRKRKTFYESWYKQG